ncbi:hypothetical protein D3C71_892380 [compost metagenome]
MSGIWILRQSLLSNDQKPTIRKKTFISSIKTENLFLFRRPHSVRQPSDNSIFEYFPRVALIFGVPFKLIGACQYLLFMEWN